MKKFFLLIILTTSFSSLFAWRAECPNLAKEIGGGWQETCKDAHMSTYVCKLSAKCRTKDDSYKQTSIDTIPCYNKNKGGLKISNCNGKLTCGSC